MIDIKDLKSAVNIAEMLDNEELYSIADQICKGTKIDEDSKSEWQEIVDKSMEIAKQYTESKNYPWPNAANIKYPLMAQACIDFASRMMPQILQNDKIVKTKVVGKDDDFRKVERAQRVADCMSFQLMDESDAWEDDTDKLLQVLPLCGTVFKKTYYDSIKKKPVSELCSPSQIVVNYDVPSLEKARRITHILELSENDIVERMRAGLYSSFDIKDLSPATDEPDTEDDKDRLHEVLEQHCFLDLDEDGYKEPYIVTVHKSTKKVLRIVNRFDTIERNGEGEILRIKPIQYFTDFHFIKSPDGGFYSMGFGTLLYSLNEAVNTIYNQLIDAGTLSNQQSGIISSGLRIKNGDYRFKPGEWKIAQMSSTMDARSAIFPLPTKEPSGTLYSLLGTLIEAGKDLTSINDALMGKQAATHVPATTMLTLVEQGLRVFNAIHKRLFRSLRKEFKKIFDLNLKYLSDKEYQRILDEEDISVKEDFNLSELDVIPVMDPNMSSQSLRLIKAQEVLKLPTVDPVVASKFYLEAMDIPEDQIKVLIPEPDPQAPPPPEVQKIMAEIQKLQAEAQKLMSEAQSEQEKNIIEAQKVGIQNKDADARVHEAAARIQKMQADSQNNQIKSATEIAKADQTATLAEREQMRKEMETYFEAKKKEIEQAMKLAEMNNSESED